MNIPPLDYSLTSNFVPFVALTLVLIFTLTHSMFSKKQTVYFVIAIVVNMISLIVVSLDSIFSFSEVKNVYVLRRITSFINFACSPIVPYLLLKLLSKKKVPFLIELPIVINITLCFLSIFLSDIVFFISINNKYSRGIFFYLPIAISIFYIGVLMLLRVNAHVQSKKNERLYLIAVIAMLMCGLAMEVAMGLRFIMWGITSIMLIMYYVLINIHLLTLDPLTGVYNRFVYNRAIDQIKGKKNCTVTVIDLNDFKTVNDRYGHAEGDRVLSVFADILNKNIGNAAKLYRYGGDEFFCLGRLDRKERLIKSIEKAAAELQKHDISFAYGMTDYYHDLDMPLDEALKIADLAMYEDKGAYKKSKNNALQQTL